MTMEPLDDDLRECVEHNMGLVYGIALAKRHSRLPVEDRIQAGTFGLMRAVQTYDPARGMLSTYATPHIKVAIQRAEMGDGLIRVPVYMHGKDARDKFLDDATRAGCMLSIHGPRDDYAHDDRGPAAREEEPRLDKREEAERVRAMVARLDEADGDVIRSRFFGGETQATVGRRRGVTRECIRLREKAALEALRRMLDPEYAA